jgi:hypothetical protein
MRRWLSLSLGLIGLFVVGAVVGGLIAGQLRPKPAPVAVVPTPTPLQTTTLSPAPSPSPSEASLQPTTTPPAETALPTTDPTATPAVEPSRSAEPTATIAPTASPSPTVDPGPVESFADELSAAISNGRRAYLLERLHPAVIERYGQRACRLYTRAIAGDDIRWEILGTSGPESWTYITDETETIIDDAATVTVLQPGADPEQRELHFAPFEGTWRWFTDCGDPLSPTV